MIVSRTYMSYSIYIYVNTIKYYLLKFVDLKKKVDTQVSAALNYEASTGHYLLFVFKQFVFHILLFCK